MGGGKHNKNPKGKSEQSIMSETDLHVSFFVVVVRSGSDKVETCWRKAAASTASHKNSQVGGIPFLPATGSTHCVGVYAHKHAFFD